MFLYKGRYSKAQRICERQTSLERLEKHSFHIPCVLSSKIIYYLWSIISHIGFYFVIWWLRPPPNRKTMWRAEQWRVRPLPAGQSLWLAPWGPRLIFPRNTTDALTRNVEWVLTVISKSKGLWAPCGWRRRCFQALEVFHHKSMVKELKYRFGSLTNYLLKAGR